MMSTRSGKFPPDKFRDTLITQCASATLLAVLMIWPNPLRAHGDAHEQLEKLTQQITAHPRDAALLVKRGELHRLHHDWDAAQADFNHAAQLDPELPLLDLLRGKLFLDWDQPAVAKLHLDHFLTKRPQHIEALVTRARAFAKLRDPPAAAKDFSSAIALSPAPKPEYFLERAQVLRRDRARFAETLRGLETGIAQLGPLVTLETLALELELEAGDYSSALARVDRLAAQSARQESWLARRGEILLQAGRPAEASAAFTQALAAAEALPDAQRKTDAMLQLQTRLRAQLEFLKNSRRNAQTQPTNENRLVKSSDAPAPVGE